MATLEQLGYALQQADAAGDTEGAQRLADAIRVMRTQPEPSTLDKVGNLARKYIVDPAVGTLEAGTALTTGALAGTAGLGAGIAGMVLPGPSGQGQDYMSRVQQAGTYQPQTPAGQRLTDIATYPFQKLGEASESAGKAVTDATGSPVLGAVTQSTVQAAPMLAGKALSAAHPAVENMIANQAKEARAVASRNSVKTQTFEAAQKEGYNVPPSYVNPTAIGNKIESVGGRAAVEQQSALENQQITNKIARREASLGRDEALSEDNLAAARGKLAGPYDEIAKISSIADSALEKLKAVRAEAKAQWDYYNNSKHPGALNKAQTLDDQALMIERVIDREATKTGRQGLVDELRDARTAMAKNYAVERSLNGGTGDADPQVFARMMNQGRPLSDGLETIARFANAYPRVSRAAPKVPSPLVNKSDLLSALALGSVGYAAGGTSGAALSVVPFLSGAARQAALSRLMQPSVGLRPYSPGLSLSAAANLTDAGITDPAAIVAVTEAKRKGLGLTQGW